METKFTKGTWSVTGQFRLDVEGGYITTQLSGSLDSTVLEREANAHLIAAAPDMYAMIESLSRELELAITKINITAMRNVTPQTETQPDMWDMESLHDAQLLLKKARGE